MSSSFNCYIQILSVFGLFIIITTLFESSSCSAEPVGYSYSKFIGPVSGPTKEIYVQGEHDHQPHVDYISKPDYYFSYGVEDPKTQNLQNRHETRKGDEVKGEYSVVDPDGTHRVVRYTADKVNGFQAEIITDGKSSTFHGHHNTNYSPVPVHHNNYNYPHHHLHHQQQQQQPPQHYDHHHHHHGSTSSNDHDEDGDDDDNNDHNDHEHSKHYLPPVPQEHQQHHNHHHQHHGDEDSGGGNNGYYNNNKNNIQEENNGDDEDDDEEDDDTY